MGVTTMELRTVSVALPKDRRCPTFLGARVLIVPGTANQRVFARVGVNGLGGFSKLLEQSDQVET